VSLNCNAHCAGAITSENRTCPHLRRPIRSIDVEPSIALSCCYWLKDRLGNWMLNRTYIESTQSAIYLMSQFTAYRNDSPLAHKLEFGYNAFGTVIWWFLTDGVCTVADADRVPKYCRHQTACPAELAFVYQGFSPLFYSPDLEVSKFEAAITPTRLAKS